MSTLTHMASAARLEHCADMQAQDNASSIRVLSARIDFEDGTASIDLLRSVAEYFVTMVDADAIIAECRAVTSRWGDFAHARGAPPSEVRMMETAFEHEETR
ncbi:hypothetical protein [Rhizobium sullae]|uniref:Uncharacterized protein n=1 Tax=Rhizobium sullae TaxID=50338 RepID=A0A4R3PUC1_RHISU|nr:hypothetical protein [Rhizobium sullae]TCU11173.1 hypothetical protein EV132_11843 [Rhizobium sullae]